jgi:UDP-N-acetylglucosamine:LPS N-acetylglucosamine transferase
MLKALGLAEILPQEKLDPERLIRLIEMMILRLPAYQRHAAKAKKLIKTDAARKIADLVENL